jgi:hypothetical protein
VADLKKRGFARMGTATEEELSQRYAGYEQRHRPKRMNRKERRAGESQQRGVAIAVRRDELEADAPTEVRDILAYFRRRVEEEYEMEFTPMQFYLQCDDRSCLYVVPKPQSREDKPLIAAVLAWFIRKNGVTRYAFILEAWTSPDTTERPVSEAPDRGECLIVGAVDIEGRKAFGRYEIERDPSGKGSLGDWDECGDVDFWPTGLFESAMRQTVH